VLGVVGREQELKFANKLTRTYAALLETLDKHRGQGQQKVTVEQVHVYPGGQAIVGNVEGGGGKSKTTEQSHAQTLAHAPEPPLRSPLQANGQAVPIAGNEERPLPDARRKSNGSPSGQ
jgi:hypothetical protein